MPEPSLLEVQRWMKERIRATGEGNLRSIELRNSDRLSVYSGGYIARRQEALEETYPAIRHVLGNRAFSGLSRAYAARHPSCDYNLSRTGRRLPEFMQTGPLTWELPFLPDLARLEWAVAEAFHAFDGPPIEPDRLAAVPPDQWDRTRLLFQPSVGLVASAWPVLDIWESRGKPVREVKVSLIGRPQRVLVFRSGFQVRCELLDELQGRALAELLAGKTLGLLCEELAASAGETEPPLSDWFARWGSAGLLADLHLTR